VNEPEFLTLDEVLGIHADQIRMYGGRSGVRDLELLRSALAMPETTFDGEFLHPTIFEIAAAYLFHVARNHPFVDGNERAALMCALVFLGLNGERLQADPDDLYQLVDGVAAGAVDKAEVSVFLRHRSDKGAVEVERSKGGGIRGYSGGPSPHSCRKRLMWSCGEALHEPLAPK